MAIGNMTQGGEGAFCPLPKRTLSSGEVLVFVESFQGCVLDTGERNYHDDSDFYAVVWDEEKQVVRNVEYATTRFWTYENYAVVDATEAVKAKANAYLEKWALAELTASDAAAARKVEKGKRVRVVKGRKVPIGTEGEVFYLAENYYGGPSYSGWARGAHLRTKIGLSIGDEMETVEKVSARGTRYTVQRHKNVAWTYAHNCEVIDPEQYETPAAELAVKAKRIHGNWRAESMYWSARAGMLVA